MYSIIQQLHIGVSVNQYIYIFNPLNHDTKYELYASYTHKYDRTPPPLYSPRNVRSDVTSSQLISDNEFKIHQFEAVRRDALSLFPIKPCGLIIKLQSAQG